MILKPLDICGPCVLYGNGLGFSRPEGTGRTGVLIVGDSLDVHEEEDGLPFRPRAQAGGVLERVIRRAGFVRDDFRIWNTIGCAPPGHVSIEGQPWQDEVVERCRSHFRRVVEEFRPKCILALGGVALKALTGFSGSKDMRVSALRGFVLDSEYCPVVSTYHPSYLRRGSSKSREKGTGAKTKGTTGPGMALLGVLIHDLKRAVAVANGSWTGWDTQPEFSGYLDGYQTQPSIQDARDLRDRAYKNPDLMIGFDLEHPKKAEDPDEESDIAEVAWLTDTARTDTHTTLSDTPTGQEIYSAQFSLGKGTGIYFPWIGEFIQIAADLLSLPNLKAGHYARVNDNPRLATWGIEVREPFIDTWELFHHLQPDIPAPLQFVASFASFPFPWKHWRQINPEWYGIADVDVLHYIVPWALKALEGLGLRGKFEVDSQGHVSVTGFEQVRRLGPVFKGMTRRGIPVNEKGYVDESGSQHYGRQEFRAELTAMLAQQRKEIQALVPDSARTVRKLGKDAAKYYQRPPATVRLALISNPNIARVEGEEGVTYVRELVSSAGNRLCADETGDVKTLVGMAAGESRDAIEWTDHDRTSVRAEHDRRAAIRGCEANSSSVAASVQRPAKPVQASLWEEANPIISNSHEPPSGASKDSAHTAERVHVGVSEAKPEPPPSRWYALEPFNPSSPAQIIAYCRAKGYEPPADRYGNLTTAAYELERLGRKTKDPIFKAILESREVVTMGGTFVDGWMPDADGRVHPRFYVAPGTGQHSSRGPNAQNSPVHTRLASAFQNIIEARPGYTLVKCIAPETKVLFADLTWRRADTVKAGDKLLGFDEFPMHVKHKKTGERTKRSGRYIRESNVEAVSWTVGTCIRIITDKGEVVCTWDHRWLVKRSHAIWIEARHIRVGDKLSWLTKPWEIDLSWGAGYIAGILDGEGSCSNGITFGQNPGAVTDLAIAELRSRGFNVVSRKIRSERPGYRCQYHYIQGPQFTWLRLIGSTRPARLLEKAKAQIVGCTSWGKGSTHAKVLGIEYLGERPAIAIQTDTKTYFAEGLLSHNCDWKSFHAVMFAFEAQDPTYMRLARMDPHSFLTAHMCNLPEKDRLLAMPDDELRERLKYIRSCANRLDPVTNECTRHSWTDKNAGKCWQYVRDSRAKPGGFGWLLGMRERTLWEQNRDAFDRIQDAKRVLDMLNRTFPKCREFQRQVQLVAHKRGRLVSRWGFVRWFWEVFKYDYATGENPPGDDSEAAIAFLIQNDAHGYRNAVMVEAEERGFNERFGLINEVHDDLRFECRDDLVAECIASVKPLMERARPELVCPVTAPYGLSVACSVATGRRLSELH